MISTDDFIRPIKAVFLPIFPIISDHFKSGHYHDLSGYNRQRQETLDESKENSLASAKYVHILDIGLLLH